MRFGQGLSLFEQISEYLKYIWNSDNIKYATYQRRTCFLLILIKAFIHCTQMLKLYLIRLLSINPPSFVHSNGMHPGINMKQGPVFTVSWINFNSAAVISNIISFNVHINLLYFIVFYWWILTCISPSVRVIWPFTFFLAILVINGALWIWDQKTSFPWLLKYFWELMLII